MPLGAGLRVTPVVAFMIAAGWTKDAPAQDAEAFYRARPTITIGYPADEVLPRMLARYLPKYLPGSPNGIVQYIPAAGGLALANQTYNTAPKDGTFLALIRGSTLQIQVNGDPAAKFDSQKLVWIGNMTKEYDTCVVGKAAPAHSIADAYSQELILGASAAGSPSLTFPLVYKAILGMKFKLIPGYARIGDRVIAMESGELMGSCGFYTNNLMSAMASPYREGKIRVLFQAGMGKDARFPDAPNVLDEAKNDADRQALQYMFATLELGRPFATAPGTPADRVAALRAAFDSAMKDADFLEEAKKIQVAIDAETGAETAASVARLATTPRVVIDRIEAILQANR